MTALTSVNSPRKVAGTLVACAVTSGIFASTGLGLAPTANASCVSLFGIPSGGCTSTLFSVGIAIGDGAVANANGLFGAAFVLGANSTATTGSGSIFNFATSIFGSNNHATAEGPIANFATNIGGSDNEVARRKAAPCLTPPPIFWAAATNSRHRAAT